MSSPIDFVPLSQRFQALKATSNQKRHTLVLGPPQIGKASLAAWIHTKSSAGRFPILSSDPSAPLGEQILGAQQGSLLIRHVEYWPLGEQKILLNYLRTQTVPDTQHHSVLKTGKARILLTACPVLEKRALGGLFNWNLFHLLLDAHILLPGLSDRIHDFERVATTLLTLHATTLRKPFIRWISAEALQMLQNYSWPGNLKELSQVLWEAILTCSENPLPARCLSMPKQQHSPAVITN